VAIPESARRTVFVDESRDGTTMTRCYGRCRRGRRLPVGLPHGHRKSTTVIAGLCDRGGSRRSSSTLR
jgi:hypothetical protein